MLCLDTSLLTSLYLYIGCVKLSKKGRVPLTVSLMRFGDVATVLLTFLLAGEKTVPQHLQCKDLPALA